MSKIKSSGLDQYGTEPFEQQQFGTAGFGTTGVEEVKFGDARIVRNFVLTTRARISNLTKVPVAFIKAREYAYTKIEYVSVYVRIFQKIEYACDTFRNNRKLNSHIHLKLTFTRLLQSAASAALGNLI